MANEKTKIVNLTVGELLEKLGAGELVLPSVPEPYPFRHLRNRKSLSAYEWQKLIEETDYLSIECRRDFSSVGGTRSSARVRRAYEHLETLRTLQFSSASLNGPDLEASIYSTQLALTVAKECLAKHNAQPRKFITYDLETGEPLNKPDYSRVDYAEVVQSMGFIYAHLQPNRAARRKMKRKGLIH
ncbi:MAG: hypothetical protein JNM39_17210 [Bdellovibrionaceae bacterium]|nr:hypothetical protein [Pseudobdellovibrionaceae bacterium]